MQLNSKIIVVPMWLLKYVKDNGLAMDSLTDLHKLSQYFSNEDLTSYVAVNKLFSAVESYHPYQSINYLSAIKDSLHLYDIINESKNNDDPTNLFLLNNIENMTSVILNEFASTKSGGFNIFMQKPIFKASPTDIAESDTIEWMDALVEKGYVPKMFYIKENVFGLTIEATEVIERNNMLLDSFDKTVELLLTYYKYVDICKTQIFHCWCRYLNLVQQKT